MARRGIKKQEHERLDDATICRVVSLLEAEKPITKKAACETLNISYNTTRLNRIIEEYKNKIEFSRKRFKANRRQPYSNLEVQELIVDYLNGDSVASISNSLYRSIHSIKQKLKELHLPERTKDSTYQQPDLIPEEAISDNFIPGELVWSARYNSVAEIRAIYDDGTMGTIYSIWVFGKHNEFAYQPAYELGKLEIVKKFNIPTEKFVKTEKSNFAYRIQ